MLEVQSLVKDYKNFRAVDSVSFTVQPGEIVGLLGPNGAGKTTALRCLSGILRPTSGRVIINGFDIATHPTQAKKHLAFVPELPSLYELLTVDEHIRFVAMCFDTVPIYEANREELLRRYHLWDKKDELVATLSKGMRQKLAVACALVHEANLFLFDEPIIGIDPAGVAEMKAEIMRMRDQGASILISTHLLDTAEKLCDRVVILAKGKLVASGTLSELQQTHNMQGKNLEEVFLDLTNESDQAAPVFNL